MLTIGALVIAALVLGSRKLGLRRAVATCMAVALGALVPLVIGSAANAAIVATVPMGTADDFSVLAGSTVTNTGDTILDESLGLAPGTAVTGFPPGEVTAPATMQIDNEAAGAGQVRPDRGLRQRRRPRRSTPPPPPTSRTSPSWAASTPGRARRRSSLTGPLVLDGPGDPNSVFIFQTNSTLITGVEQHRVADQRRAGVQRVLAGRQLRHARAPARSSSATSSPSTRSP